jgi:hypothetical protein
MRKLVLIAGVALVIVAAVFPPGSVGSSAGQTMSTSWGDAAAEKLSKFLPAPASGLAPGMPWDRPTDHEPVKWAGIAGGDNPV